MFEFEFFLGLYSVVARSYAKEREQNLKLPDNWHIGCRCLVFASWSELAKAKVESQVLVVILLASLCTAECAEH